MAKQKKLRILFNSNAPWSVSGYGTQMYDLLPMIRDAGYPVAIVAFYGLEGNMIELNGIRCYPKIAGQWGDDAVIEHQRHFGAHTVMTFQDIWVLNPQNIAQFRNWIPIVPIDHDPVPPAVFERLRAAYRVVTYSEFGHKELKRAGMHSNYIQHTVDTKTFYPRKKEEIRKKIGIDPDVFLFGMVAANKDNPPRKSFQQVLEAFKQFLEKHPKSMMYFHTLTRQHGGFPIAEYAKILGIQDKIVELAPYDVLYTSDRARMADIYSMLDCLLMPSTNEGFGVPAIEAQACGVPVITNNFTSMPELIVPGKTGFLTETMWKRFSPIGSYISHPSAESIYDCMEKVFAMDRKVASKQAQKHVRENYDLKTIFEQKWVPFLEKLESELVVD